MPNVDPDCLLVPPCEDIICDRCKAREHYEPGHEIAAYWLSEIFYKRHKPDAIQGTFCKRCAVLMTPWVYKLRDIDELTMYVNKLERAIREKRTQNNRATSPNAGERSQGRA
jgi:hypothetical protein